MANEFAKSVGRQDAYSNANHHEFVGVEFASRQEDPSILGHLGTLDENLDLLEKSIANFFETINPFLRNNEDANEMARIKYTPEDGSNLSFVSAHLVNAIHRVRWLQSRLAEVNQRVDV